MVVIEMVVDVQDEREVRKVGKVVTRSGETQFQKLAFVLVLAATAETIQVSGSIAWVRCASSNVYTQKCKKFRQNCLAT